jgi:hypothetical protein
MRIKILVFMAPPKTAPASMSNLKEMNRSFSMHPHLLRSEGGMNGELIEIARSFRL